MFSSMTEPPRVSATRRTIGNPSPVPYRVRCLASPNRLPHSEQRSVKATKDDGIDYIHAVGAPTIVEVIEQHPDRLLALQVLRNELHQVAKIVLVQQLCDLGGA